MGYYDSTREYIDLMQQLSSYSNIPRYIKSRLEFYTDAILESDMEKIHEKPMVVIGMYIAVASLCCVLPMLADLLHGLRSRKLWFPCKFFFVNAVTLAAIAVAMKLPVDLSSSLPGDVDQVAKLGSIAFMCTMMANFLPSLATMDGVELLTNIMALGVIVITLMVNIIIQIYTGVVGGIPNGKARDELESLTQTRGFFYLENPVALFFYLVYTIAAIIYVTLLGLLLIIHVSSSFEILRSKEIIESKYKEGHKSASEDLKQSPGKLLTVKRLKEHVRKYWIMAESGNPQFILACSVTSIASGVICVFTFVIHFLVLVLVLPVILVLLKGGNTYDSPYRWSTIVILIVQSSGVLIGTIAPLFRCFASISFKLSVKSMSKHIKVYNVEEHWTRTLYDWKYGSISLPLLRISLPFGNHKIKVVVRALKNLSLSVFIILQTVVVVVCKIIALVPFVLTICLRCLMWLIRAVFSSQETSIPHLELHNYVLQLEEEDELAERTLKRLVKSLDRLIQKSEKKRSKNLKELLKKKTTNGFQGVGEYDNNDHHVNRSPTGGEDLECWSLPVVTLTTIAITLPTMIGTAEAKTLLKSVREGLKYVTLVEESLPINERRQKAAKLLWEEVDFCHEWLEIKLKYIGSPVNPVQETKTPENIRFLLDKAKEIDIEIKNKNKKAGRLDDKSKHKNICADSMSRIAQTIIDDEQISHTQSYEKILFDQLSSMIADIMAACLTSLPDVIAEKCHTKVIEKREASVKVAAKLLGETKEIIDDLQSGNLQEKWKSSGMTTDESLRSIDKWRANMSQP